MKWNFVQAIRTFFTGEELPRETRVLYEETRETLDRMTAEKINL